MHSVQSKFSQGQGCHIIKILSINIRRFVELSGFNDIKPLLYNISLKLWYLSVLSKEHKHAPHPLRFLEFQNGWGVLDLLS